MCLSIRRSSGLPSSWRGQPAAHQWYVHAAVRHCDTILYLYQLVFYQYSIFSDYSHPGVTPAVWSHLHNENLTVFPLDGSNNLLSAPLLAVTYNSSILKPVTAKWRRWLVENRRWILLKRTNQSCRCAAWDSCVAAAAADSTSVCVWNRPPTHYTVHHMGATPFCSGVWILSEHRYSIYCRAARFWKKCESLFICF